MDKENEFKPGDVVVCKFTRKTGMVLKEEDQNKEVVIRNSDGTKDTYFTFELIPYSSDGKTVTGGTL